MGQVNSGPQNINNFVNEERQEDQEEQAPLTEEEQIELLEELAPDDPVDTPAERQEQINLLDQLMDQ